MNTQRFITALTAAVFLCASAASAQSPCRDDNAGSEVMGTLIGGAIGGLIGSQIGDGTGQKIAIGAGVLGGMWAGNQIARSMTCRDQRYHNQTAQRSFETQTTGTTSTWRNPDSGHQGSVTPVRTYQRADGVYCREFEQAVYVDGQQERATGTACRQNDGTWQIVSR